MISNQLHDKRRDKMTKRLNQILPIFLVAVLFAVGAVPALAMKPERTTIVDVALDANAQTGEFSILIQALLAADPAVFETLDGNGQFTVFAPTDDAFNALLGELNLTPEELLGNQELVTLQRGFLFQSGGVLTDANGRTASIIATDIMADNGIIHVIDQVVLP
jgi:uncharacterized surface protein with fasciclin (FAS1) repeats